MFEFNSANDDSYSNPSGGALHLGATSTTLGKLENCIFRGNSMTQGYGAVSVGGSPASPTEVINCLIVNNSGTHQYGGNEAALYLNGGVRIINSTVANNVGGIYYNGATATGRDMINTLVYGNTLLSFKNGGAIENITNCAINVTQTNVETLSSATVANFVDLTSTAIEDIFASPTSFAGLPTDETQKAELVAADWQLISNSPCINAGSNNAAPAKDLTGNYRINQGTVDIGTYEYYEPAVTWMGASGNDKEKWSNSPNWAGNSMPSCTGTTAVTISENAQSYPVLETNEKVASITFEPGAEIGNQHLLAVTDQATVHYKLPTNDVGRWNMISVPVSGNIIVKYDFHFGNLPKTYIKELRPFVDGVNTYIHWEYERDGNRTYNLGDGFAFGIDKTSIPDATEQASNTYSFEISGELAKETVTETLLFGADDAYGNNPFAIVGNPFMTTIDFTKLVGNNSIISSNYLIWTGDGFSGFTEDGIYGAISGDAELNAVSLDECIAPLQSFIVEKSTSNNNPNNVQELVFNLADISVDINGNNVIGQGVLRSTQNNGNKIDIIADNGLAKALTFIAKRDNAQSARKLISKDLLPDIYTLNGEKAYGAQFINSDSLAIPVGISTTYSGEMTLTLSGMDNYDNDVNITLLDKSENGGQPIDLTSKSSYTHTFTHTPNTNGTPVEDRFQIAFAPKSITGMNNAEYGKNISVYCKDNYLYAIASLIDKIRQIYVYDLQGNLIYADAEVNAPMYIMENLSDNTYVVTLITDKGVKNAKVINK